MEGGGTINGQRGVLLSCDVMTDDLKTQPQMGRLSGNINAGNRPGNDKGHPTAIQVSCFFFRSLKRSNHHGDS